MKMQTPVLIVGAGPIGLALAGDLGFRGVPCMLIERSDGQVVQPKMDMIGVRTMEYCRRWGIVPWVHEAGYNREYPQDCAWVTTLTGYEFGREVFPAPKDESARRRARRNASAAHRISSIRYCAALPSVRRWRPSNITRSWPGSSKRKTA